MGLRGVASAPKVFISYSWTNEEHTEWVGDLGQRLMTDGIDVILDQWSLEDGHDANAFMEKMVSDPSIKRVIIVSDALYAAKADGRKGGVGTETQIISKEVYDSVEQTKFIPLLRERDEQGKACLPIYLTTRKYIDFSDSDNEAEAYDQLLRNIFERPRRPKPTIGKAPSHLFDDEATVVTSAQRAKRFRDFVTSGRGNPSAAFEDFAEEFLVNFNDLRMTYSRDDEATWCERIEANISKAIAHRDVFVDVVKIGAAHLPSDQFVPPFLGLLERILPFQERPEAAGSYYEASEDNYKFLLYELFLYSFAAFVKAKKYGDARKLLDYRYVAQRTFGGNHRIGHTFTSFSRYARSLEEVCGRQGNRRLISFMAYLIHERAVRTDLRFSDLMQADLLLWLASKGSWWPRCPIYARSGGTCELFLRAVNDEGFTPLKQILQLNSGPELLQFVSSDTMLRIVQELHWRGDIALEECLNLEVLQHCWGKPS